MKQILSKTDIRSICLANGFKVKVQGDGTQDLNPYVYDAAHALIEAGLSSVLLSRTGSLRDVLKNTPDSTLNIPQYNQPCRTYASDWARVETLMDKLQFSMVQRFVGSSKLWNISVVDKHGEFMLGVVSKPLGPAMHEIEQLLLTKAAEVQSVPNEPFFEPMDPRAHVVWLAELNGVTKGVCNVHINNHKSLNDIDVVLGTVSVLSGSFEETKTATMRIAKAPYFKFHSYLPAENVGNHLESMDLKVNGVGKHFIPPILVKYDYVTSPSFRMHMDELMVVAEAAGIQVSFRVVDNVVELAINGTSIKGSVASDVMVAAFALVTDLIVKG